MPEGPLADGGCEPKCAAAVPGGVCADAEGDAASPAGVSVRKAVGTAGGFAAAGVCCAPPAEGGCFARNPGGRGCTAGCGALSGCPSSGGCCALRGARLLGGSPAPGVVGGAAGAGDPGGAAAGMLAASVDELAIAGPAGASAPASTLDIKQRCITGACSCIHNQPGSGHPNQKPRTWACGEVTWELPQHVHLCQCR